MSTTNIMKLSRTTLLTSMTLVAATAIAAALLWWWFAKQRTPAPVPAPAPVPVPTPAPAPAPTPASGKYKIATVVKYTPTVRGGGRGGGPAMLGAPAGFYTLQYDWNGAKVTDNVVDNPSTGPANPATMIVKAGGVNSRVLVTLAPDGKISKVLTVVGRTPPVVVPKPVVRPTMPKPTPTTIIAPKPIMPLPTQPVTTLPAPAPIVATGPTPAPIMDKKGSPAPTVPMSKKEMFRSGYLMM